jgi:hypothetical protein
VLRRGRVVHSGPTGELTEADLFEHYLGGGVEAPV